MREMLRSAWVGMLVSMMVIDPATACRFCGQSRGYSAPSYSYSNETSCCSSPCQSCGYSEVVVSEPCGGCQSCGDSQSSGCASCESSGCQSCGGDGRMIESQAPTEVSPPMMAPQPPTSHPTTSTPAPVTPAAPPRTVAPSNSMPSTVNKPMQPTPAPSLPPQKTPNAALPPMNSSPSNTSMPKETSKPAADDLFGAPEKPSNTGNDLFGPSTDTKAAPAKAAPTFESSTPAEPKLAPPAEKPSAPAGDDLFGAPSNEPAAPAEKPSAPAEGEKAPADKDKDKKKDDDLFGGFGAILREPGGLASNEMRHWVDDSGHFTCEGRLTKVLDGKVQLLKDNGHTSTVPLSRLSQVDLSFVYRQASAERGQSGVQTAQYTPAGR